MAAVAFRRPASFVSSRPTGAACAMTVELGLDECVAVTQRSPMTATTSNRMKSALRSRLVSFMVHHFPFGPNTESFEPPCPNHGRREFRSAELRRAVDDLQ